MFFINSTCRVMWNSGQFDIAANAFGPVSGMVTCRYRNKPHECWFI